MGAPKKGNPNRTQKDVDVSKRSKESMVASAARAREGLKTRKKKNDMSKDLYDRAMEAYLEHPTITNVFKTCKISAKRATILVNEGWNGLEPIKDRYNKIMTEANEKADSSYAEVMAQFIDLFNKLLKGPVKESLENIQAYDLSDMEKKDLFKMVSQLMRDYSFAMGGPDSRIDFDIEKISKVTGLPVEEVKELKKQLDE